ncbi:MAG: hypothetical protein NTY65_04330, partial [Planctomycetota bacterium]|nr:hypothetical protein [Planctomycetota bacterium]
PVKGAAAPLQLPASSVIDLDFSGTDLVTFGSVQDVMILFAPNGSVLQMYYGNGSVENVVQPIFLMVGKNEQTGPGATKTNSQDTTNFWVAINPQTGLVTTDVVAAGGDIATSRQFVRDAQGMGGK